MKIKSVELETSYLIETEDEKIYRRYGSEFWEELVGRYWEPISWEPVMFHKNREILENLFQEYMKNKQEALSKMYKNEEELGLDW